MPAINSSASKYVSRLSASHQHRGLVEQGGEGNIACNAITTKNNCVSEHRAVLLSECENSGNIFRKTTKNKT